MNKIIELKNITKYFEENGKKVEILNDLSLTVNEGEKIAIIGPSGSGKSTILSLLAGLDTPQSGEVVVAGKTINKLDEKTLAEYRNEEIGIIFQSFELILPFSVRENISAPQDIKKEINAERVDGLIERVNLVKKSHSAVTNLSGGEKQRVAIARALSNNPSIILADEPTGSLDRLTGDLVLDLLVNITTKEKRTLIVITHDEVMAKKMDKVYLLRDKKLVLQEN